MKKITIVFFLALASTGIAQVYPGLKNPTSFETGDGSYYWRARVGILMYYKRANQTSVINMFTDGYRVNNSCIYKHDISGDATIKAVTSSTTQPTECSFSHKDAGNQRFRIIGSDDNGLDNFTIRTDGSGGLRRIPDGFTSSVRLGDIFADPAGALNMQLYASDTNEPTSVWFKNQSAEALFYTMKVRADYTILRLKYALVARHHPANMPGWASGEFVMRIVAQNPDGTWPKDMVADSSKWMRMQMPSLDLNDTVNNYLWEQGAIENGGTCNYWYLPWQSLTTDLGNFIGQNVRIELYNSDANSKYPMYAYFVADYEPAVLTNFGCTPETSDASDTLYAPLGMPAYKWFASENGQLDLTDTATAMAAPLRLLSPADYDGTGDDSTFVSKFAPHYDDFKLADGSVADTQTFCCMMFHSLNGKAFDSTKIFINIPNTKPAAEFEFESPCGGPVKLHNITPNQPDIDSDTSSTWWFLYDDTLATVPYDTLYGRDTSFKFEREGWYKVTLRAFAHDKSCIGVTTKNILALHGAQAVINTPSLSVCAGEMAHLHATDDTLITTRRWTVNGHVYESSVLNPYDSLVLDLPLGPSDISLYVSADNGCADSVTISIFVSGTPALSFIGNDEGAICPGDSARLTSVGTYALNNVWVSTPSDPRLATQQGMQTIIVQPDTTTVYTLKAPENSSCGQQDKSIVLEVVPPPIPAVKLSNTFVNTEHPVILAEDISRYGYSTTWYLSDSTRSDERWIRHTFTDLSVESVKITMRSCNKLNCCSNDTTIILPIETAIHWLPDVFTPDRDNNSTFGVTMSQPVSKYEFYIYSRNGQLVFQSTDQNERWDGTYNGHPCPSGAYVYYLRYSFNYNGTRHHTTGTVTLLR
ncbi:MAG: gliding motility-associated C-terminal domain-containing protein [Bacteroidales bacterium]|nr:gliding motility-associated C-terminal domain-containing protein [Bacteroidales bacterium]